MRLSKNESLVSVSNRSSVNGSGVQNKQESSSDSASESGSDEESDYESDSDEQPEADLPDLLRSARPTDSVKAIEYDVVETVWRQPNRRVEPEDIRSALGRYEKLIKELRDKWKQEENAVAQAEEKKDQALVEKSKGRAAARLKVLENACRLTEQYGHQDIVGRYVYLFWLLTFWYIVKAHVPRVQLWIPLPALVSKNKPLDIISREHTNSSGRPSVHCWAYSMATRICCLQWFYAVLLSYPTVSRT